MRSISIANRHPRLRFDRRSVTRAMGILDEHRTEFVLLRSSLARLPSGELSLVLLTDAALAKLHAAFLDDPSPTDVITFDGDPLLGTAGEICVSADAAARHVALPLASRPSTALQAAFSAELTLYLVHGWLHLAGYDDLVPAKKRIMRRAEARAMRVLQRADAVPKFNLKSRR